jgi:hypothetical protein
MSYIGRQPTAAALTASDITDGIISTAKVADAGITNAKLAQDIISADTALATQPALTDEILLSDAGTLKRLDIKHIQNTPAFEAYTTAAQSLSDNTKTKLTFATEIYDSDGTYDNSTNYRFTPAVAGKYYVYAKCVADPSAYANGRDTNMYIYKNGSESVLTSDNWMPGDNSSTYGWTAVTDRVGSIVDLDDDDYVEIFYRQNTWSDSGAQCLYKIFGAFRIAGI